MTRTIKRTVRERAETIATLRHIEIALMEMLARWVPTTPLMEAKVLMGRHIWETAQHADLLGKRTYELRAPMHFTLAPAAEYAALLNDISAVTHQAERIALFYDVLLPAVRERCRHYIDTTDPLLDEPSVRVLRRIISDTDAIISEAHALRAEQPALHFQNDERIESMKRREREIEQFVASSRAAEAAHV